MASADQEAAPLTAEEFARRPDSNAIEELVRGRVVTSPLPGLRHGYVCATLARVLGDHVAGRDFGRVLSRTGVVTARSPDSVRGPDVSYYSYARMPKGREPVGYAAVPPELVFEVLCPDDRWVDILTKVAEYLNVDVTAVVLEPAERRAWMFLLDAGPRGFGPDDVLRLEPILPGFEVVVGDLFG